MMFVNGQEVSFEHPITVSELLERLNLKPERVVVEVNLHVVAKDSYSQVFLSKGDRVEIVSFVGGG